MNIQHKHFLPNLRIEAKSLDVEALGVRVEALDVVDDAVALLEGSHLGQHLSLRVKRELTQVLEGDQREANCQTDGRRDKVIFRGHFAHKS